MNKEQRLNILFTGIRWIIELCFEILCFNLMMRKKTLWKLFSLQSRIHLWDCSISNGTSTKQRLTTSTYCSTIIRKVLLWHNSFNALECKLILWKCCFTAKIVVVVFFSFCCEKKNTFKWSKQNFFSVEITYFPNISAIAVDEDTNYQFYLR